MRESLTYDAYAVMTSYTLGLVFRNAKRKENNLGSTVFSRNLTINAVTINFLTILIVGKL